jgi:hypothetical protein
VHILIFFVLLIVLLLFLEDSIVENGSYDNSKRVQEFINSILHNINYSSIYCNFFIIKILSIIIFFGLHTLIIILSLKTKILMIMTTSLNVYGQPLETSAIQ